MHDENKIIILSNMKRIIRAKELADLEQEENIIKAYKKAQSDVGKEFLKVEYILNQLSLLNIDRKKEFDKLVKEFEVLLNE